MTIANIQGIKAASKGLMTGVKKMDKESSFANVMSETGFQKAYAKDYHANNPSKASAPNASAEKDDASLNARTDQNGQTTKKLDNAKDDSRKLNQDSSKALKQEDEVTNASDAVGNTVDEEAQDIAAAVVNEIRSIVQEALQLSDEDMEALMGELQLTDKDLLNPDNVLKLVMEQNGIHSTMDILNNEELALMVKDLMKAMDAVKATIPAEQLTMLMNDSSKEAVLVDTASIVSSEVTTVAEPEDSTVQTVKVIVEGDNGAMKQQNADSGASQQSFQQSGREFFEQPVLTNGQTVFEGLTQAVSNTQTISYSGNTQAMDIVTQLVNEIRAVVKAETQSMEVQLNPESLGKVHIQVIAREGILTAQITAQTEAARNAIESQLVTLKESFQNQGLKVEAVEVTVGMQSFNMDQRQSFEEQQQSFNKARRQLRLDDMDLEDEELTEEESIAVDMMRRDGNQVDFSA